MCIELLKLLNGKKRDLLGASFQTEKIFFLGEKAVGNTEKCLKNTAK